MKVKRVFADSIWSISGLLLMNIIAQFLVYPIWNQRLGNEQYGNVLYMISLMNIFSISIGSGINYAVIKENIGNKVNNIGYNFLMIIATVIMIPIGYILGNLKNINLNNLEIILFIILIVATMWRFYADVEYRIQINYKGYFLYYLSISIGYILGIFLFALTGLWPVTLLPGELLGLIIVWKNGNILHFDRLPTKRELICSTKFASTLCVTNLISNVIFNGDRLLLKNILTGTSVTIYYQASLLGKTASLISTPMNSVIIGYLARTQKSLTLKWMNIITVFSLILSLLGTIICTFASHIIIGFLYPQNYSTIKNFFIVANAAQILYFVTNIITVILLRYGKVEYQIYVNVAYAIGFFVLCIPSTICFGITGFCIAILVVCSMRMFTAIILGYRSIHYSERRNIT